MTACNAEEWLLERLASNCHDADHFHMLLRSFAELPREIHSTARGAVRTLDPTDIPTYRRAPQGSCADQRQLGATFPGHRPARHLPGRAAPFRACCLTLHVQWSGVSPDPPAWAGPGETRTREGAPGGGAAGVRLLESTPRRPWHSATWQSRRLLTVQP